MFVESLELFNFRNYKNLHISFDKGTNIFYGDNAQGKTNILEAVYMASTAKSHRVSKDKEIILFGEEEAHIKMFVRKEKFSERIDMHLKKSRAKGIAINGIPIRKASKLFGISNVVIFSPEDLNLIKNGPSDRRRFIDMELCQLDSLYTSSLSNYNNTLMQRNRLLKELQYNNDYLDLIKIYDIQIVKYGKDIIKKRQTFINELNNIITDIHYRLTGYKENLKLIYEPNVSADCFEQELEKGLDRDIKNKVSLTGPHRDDMLFTANDIDLRKYGSQGQQRSAALSLKLAEIEFVKKRINDSPVLLLDDVLSELDGSRQEQLLECISNIQTFITCTGLDDFVNNHFTINKIFRVINGTVISEN